MRDWLRRLGSLSPYLLSGIACTLFMAWGLPLILASRGFGPWDAPLSLWHRGPSSELWSDHAPSLSVRRSAFSDWYIAEPVITALEVRKYWPDTDLEDSNGHARSAPSAVVVAPHARQDFSWGRIDTGMAGWPFRCFASEAWYRTKPDGGYEPMPEFHWNAYIGMIGGQHILVPLRPLPFAFLLNVLFWSSVTWALVAGPREFRRRRRAKYGRCTECGYEIGKFDVKRPERCPECGAAFVHDPLGFAHSPEMHFQNAYVWVIFVSSLDIMLTWRILDRGGIEVNPLAALVIDAWGMQGAIAFKFALMMWVIIACEILARMKRRAGKFLAYSAVVISASPVVWSLFLLFVHSFFPAVIE
jgi:hypothetical protein